MEDRRSITLWRVISWQPGIIQHEFEKVTANFAIDRAGKRHALRSDHQGWFETRGQAIDWKLAYLMKRRDEERRAYELAQCELVDFQKQEGLL